MNTQIKELKKLKGSLISQLLRTDNTREQFVSIRSQYYIVSSELYFLKKRVKSQAKFKGVLNIDGSLNVA